MHKCQPFSEDLKKGFSYINLLLWIGGLFLVSFFLLFVINLAYPNEIEKVLNKNQPTNNQDKIADPAEIIGDGRHSLGTEKPKILVVEFSDFTCPFCKSFYPKIKRLISKHPGEVKLIYRHFINPAYEDYKNRLQIALASECAQEQGKFWEAHDRLFERQDYYLEDDLVKKERLLALAEELKINVHTFSDCLNQAKYLNKIKEDFYTAQKYNLQGTPTWFINGYEIRGDVPENMIEDFFNKIINKN